MRCTAKSKRSGERCRREATPGARVCASHGSKAPQVQRSARERLAALADPAVAALAEVLKRALKVGDLNAATRAAVAVLDRTGHGTSSMVGTLDLTLLSDAQLAALVAGASPMELITMPSPTSAPSSSLQRRELPGLRLVPPPPPEERDQWIELK